MIAALKGKLNSVSEFGIRLDVGGVVYELSCPLSVRAKAQEAVARAQPNEQPEFEVVTYSYIESPGIGNARPRLIAFSNEMEREFFELLIEVQDVGARKALQCLSSPLSTLARAIEAEDVAYLSKTIKGVGPRGADKIVATLKGKCARYALIRDEALPVPKPPTKPEAAQQAVEALRRLGYSDREAASMVDGALAAKPKLAKFQDIMDEVFRQSVGTR